MEVSSPITSTDSVQRSHRPFSEDSPGPLPDEFETEGLSFAPRFAASTIPDHHGFRGLVMAHSVWYPKLAKDVRQTVVDFIIAVLDGNGFDPRQSLLVIASASENVRGDTESRFHVFRYRLQFLKRNSANPVFGRQPIQRVNLN